MDMKEAITRLLEGDSIVGITRLQKLLFLIEKECGERLIDSDFEPYKFGPFSKKVQDDIEFLVNLGYIESSNDKITINKKKNLEDIYQMSAKDFLSSPTPAALQDYNPINYEKPNPKDDEFLEEPVISKDNVVYRITEKGQKYLTSLGKDATNIKKIKSRYAGLSLSDLISYVYAKYPDYTVESEIKDRYL